MLRHIIIIILIFDLGCSSLVTSFQSLIKCSVLGHCYGLSITTPLYSSNTNNDEPFHLKKVKKYITPYIEERLNIGKVYPYELEKYFPISKRESESFKRGSITSIKGFMGVILSLEDIIINLRDVYEYSFTYFTQSLSISNADGKSYKAFQSSNINIQPSKIHDIIGCSFKDSLRGLGWDIKDTSNDEEMEVLSSKFYDVFNFMLDKFPNTNANPGVMKLINDIIDVIIVIEYLTVYGNQYILYVGWQ